eukprot:gene14574-biopygen8111
MLCGFCALCGLCLLRRLCPLCRLCALCQVPARLALPAPPALGAWRSLSSLSVTRNLSTRSTQSAQNAQSARSAQSTQGTQNAQSTRSTQSTQSTRTTGPRGPCLCAAAARCRWAALGRRRCPALAPPAPLEGRERELGAAHPDTLASMYTLVWNLPLILPLLLCDRCGIVAPSPAVRPVGEVPHLPRSGYEGSAVN